MVATNSSEYQDPWEAKAPLQGRGVRRAKSQVLQQHKGAAKQAGVQDSMQSNSPHAGHPVNFPSYSAREDHHTHMAGIADTSTCPDHGETPGTNTQEPAMG